MDMSNIEEDIELLKKFNPGDEYTKRIKNAIDNVLEENKRLKAKIDVTNWQEKTVYECLKEKYIPKQKVKEEVDKLLNTFRKVKFNRITVWNNLIQLKEKLLEDK